MFFGLIFVFSFLTLGFLYRRRGSVWFSFGDRGGEVGSEGFLEMSLG